MSVGSICSQVVVTGSPDESVLDIARRMQTNNVGTVVLVNAAREPMGIVTDRDIVLRCVCRSLDAGATPVSAVMTRDVRSVDASTPVHEALRTMATMGARRLVVTDMEETLVGILSVDDLAQVLIEEATSISRLLGKEAPTLA
jgi:CBS domain-containing protein